MKPELSLIVNIESGLVRGSLVLFTPDRPAHILYSTSSEITSRGQKSADHKSGNTKLLSSMLNSVSALAENVIHKGIKMAVTRSHSGEVLMPISKIHIIFSSPWIISKTKTVKIEYAENRKITKAAITKILDSERLELEERFKKEQGIQDTRDVKGDSVEFDLAFIEQKIFEVKLNGYPTADFEGKETRKLEVSFGVSISSKIILNRIETALEKAIRMEKKNISYHSSLLLQYTALRNLIPGKNDYLAIHIHHEISDLILVRHGICAAMASFPLGTSAVSKMSSLMLGQSMEVADSSLALHSKNAFHFEEKIRVAAAADPIVHKWAQQLHDTLAALGQSGSPQMPDQLYVFTNDHYPHFERALSKFSKVTFFDKSMLDSSISHTNKEREDILMNMYVYALK